MGKYQGRVGFIAFLGQEKENSKFKIACCLTEPASLRLKEVTSKANQFTYCLEERNWSS